MAVVNTGGGVILDNSTIISIPDNTALICGETGLMLDNAGSDYRIFKSDGSPNLTHAIVVDPTAHDDGHGGITHYTIALSGQGSLFGGCAVEAGAGAPNQETGLYPNPYSPSVWYSGCTAVATATSRCTDGGVPLLRSTISEYSAFNPNQSALYAAGAAPAAGSVAITVTGAGDQVRNVTTMGFEQCYSSSGKGKAVIIDHLTGDCDGGLSIVSSSDATQISGIQIRPFLTNGNGTASFLASPILTITGNGAGKYWAYIVENPTPGSFRFAGGDTVWISTNAATGTESAAGRWTVTDLAEVTGAPCPTDATCQRFTLGKSLKEPDSQSAPIQLGGIANGGTPGVPPNAITGIDPSPGDTGLQLVAVGQAVSGPCVPVTPQPPVVTDVWPAKGIVYISRPLICTSPHPGQFTFSDGSFTDLSPDCVSSPDQGCATVDANERFGDGVFIEDSGGVSAVNCQVYEHLVAYHFYTNTNSSRFSNCGTGENTGLPDQDIVGLKIDGDHISAAGDACGNGFINSVLGQHRTVSILVQSNCSTPNELANVHMTTHAGGRRNAVGLEVDAGSVLLSTSHAVGIENVFKADSTQLYKQDGTAAGNPAPASLSISSNSFLQATLFMSDSNAAASTNGCGNTFAAPTPYLCAPSSFTQLPGGRLTLTQSQPVMQSGVTGAATVYYVPYVSQQAPIYNPTAGVFGLTDIGASGLTLALGSSAPAANTLYDLYVETLNDTTPGAPELCAGPAWASSTAGSSSRSAALDVTSVNGVWVNQPGISCTNGSGTVRTCPPLSCTYVGTIYTGATAGTVSQQFNPAPANGGAAPCLCVYNAYNRVALTSRSNDNTGYSYDNGSGWRSMHGSASNRVTVVDGLAQMQGAAQLGDALGNASGNARTAEMGIEFNTSGSSLSTPLPLVMSNSATSGTYSTSDSSTPYLGLWYAQAVEAAPGTGATPANFGGGPGGIGTTNFQQLSVQVAD